jgi:hypothetical protein
VSKYLDTRTDDGEPPAIRRSGINCAEAGDLIPALALGAIETGERHALRLHCRSCPACTRLLEASERVTAFLPFAAPSLTPPDRAKHALFARIADAQPASAVSVPPVYTSVAHLDTPVIDSPAGKRHKPAAPRAAQRPAGEHGAVSWPLSVLSSGVGKLATGSLALAFVLVTIYALQATDLVNDGPEVTPSAAAQVQPTSEVAQAQSTVPAAETEQADDDSFSSAAVGTVNVDTQGASATEPVLQPLSTNGLQTYVYKTVSSGSQTELLRSVAPRFADCTLKQVDANAYAVTVSGIRLPGNGHQAGVFLVTYSGERMLVATIQINELGDGNATFTIDQPLSDFRTLQIGAGTDSISAQATGAMFGAVSFSLISSDSGRGLQASN